MVTHIATFLLKVFSLGNYGSTSTDIQIWMDGMDGWMDKWMPKYICTLTQNIHAVFRLASTGANI